MSAGVVYTGTGSSAPRAGTPIGESAGALLPTFVYRPAGFALLQQVVNGCMGGSPRPGGGAVWGSTSMASSPTPFSLVTHMWRHRALAALACFCATVVYMEVHTVVPLVLRPYRSGMMCASNKGWAARQHVYPEDESYARGPVHRQHVRYATRSSFL
eukprot:COSAG01_NODE_30358_length_617_cov_1.241313_1_plen_156_part_01